MHLADAHFQSDFVCIFVLLLIVVFVAFIELDNLDHSGLLSHEYFLIFLLFNRKITTCGLRTG